MPQTPFMSHFVRIAGSINAALMLSKLHQWFTEAPTKLRIMREGKLWLAKSHREWEEDCGLTRQETRSAEALLIGLGLVQKKVWKFNGMPISHYRLLLIINELGGMVTSNQTITIGLESKAKTNNTNKTEFSGKPRTAEGQEMKQKTTGERNSKEVLEDMKKKISMSSSKPEKVSAKSLSVYWQALMAKHHDVGFQKPHTMRDLGILVHYIKVTGVHAVPAMEWAVANWPKFRYRAQEELGEGASSTPTTGSLLKGCTVAVEGYQKEASKVDFQEPVHSSAPKIVHGEEKDAPATEAEIRALLKSLDKP